MQTGHACPRKAVKCPVQVHGAPLHAHAWCANSPQFGSVATSRTEWLNINIRIENWHG